MGFSESTGGSSRSQLFMTTAVWRIDAGGAGAIHPIYFGRGNTILLERERIKRKTIENRRLNHQNKAA